MKISARPLKGEPFDVECDVTDTVEALKMKIAAARPELPADQMKLVHTGRVLQNTSTVQDAGIKEGDFVVIMLSKAKPAAPDAAPAPAAAAAPSAGGAAPAGQQAASSLVSGAGLEATVQMLCAMGFPRASVEQCLRAAFNNPDRAVEYLMGGIPEGLQAQAAAQPPGGAAAAPTPAAPAQPAAPPMGQGAMPAFQPPAAAGGPSPFPQMPGAQQQQLGGAAAASGPLAALRNHPRFFQLRMAVQQNPAALNQVMAVIAQADPNLITAIAENQEEFVEMLQDPVAGGAPGGGGAQDPVAAMMAAAQAAGMGGAAGAPSAPGMAPAAGAPSPQLPGQLPGMMPAPGAAPPGGAGVQLSPAEQEAIQRLQALGFDRRQCLEAYLACDRNEELAASYLFDMAEG